ncbi:MAG: efflux RND transporter periplasmic adaptor subunit [Rhodanobacteraceae bacterium]|jgi:multidrug efflux system membrane fusion protein|nr:efflux RND transporter periplasmic adaptor subunit [Rhodanobacteraceae bacterium]
MRWKSALALVVVILLAVLGWRLLPRSAQVGGPGMRGGGAEAPIPVTVVAAATTDVPVYLSALGTAQALNTVNVNAQVSGQIKTIAFTEGQEIAQGALIAEIDPRTYQAALDQALAKKQQDEAQLVAAKATLARYEDLIKKNFVAAQELQNQRQTVAQQQALIAADDAAIASARTQLGYTKITAPITGIAGIRQVDVGNLVSANSGSPIVVLTQVHPINVIFTLPQQHLGEVRGASGELPVSALDRGDAHVLAQGVLKVVDNTIDTQTGTFKLKAEFGNADNALWPGQFVNVRLQTRTVHGGLVIPVQAVQRGPDSSYVYLLQPDNTVMMQTITIGGEGGELGMLVTDGLKPGDKVVTEGQFRLKPGAKVLPLAPGESAPTMTAEELKKAATPGQRRRGG